MDGPFVKAKAILTTLHNNGYQAYFVGGSVRDYLLQRPIGDIDIATSARPEQIIGLFPKTIDVGAVHGTVIVLYKDEHYEVTTFRTEEGYDDYRRPSYVEFVTSLHEDLRRRDFTMNAIAMTINGDIIDPFAGKKAIEEKQIRTVGDPNERFFEDALRMMRAVRFVSQLSFSLCKDTELAIKENASLLKKISVERITIEFEKLLNGPSCQDAIPILITTDLFKYLPGLADDTQHLKELSLYKWDQFQKRAEIWTLVCYLLNKDDINAFLRNWKLPNKIIDQVIKNVAFLRKVIQHGWNKRLLYDCGEESIQQIERILGVLGVHQDVSASHEFSKLIIKQRSDLKITGEDFLRWYNQKPGKWVAELYETVENGILENKVENNKEKIKEWLLSCNQK
ncbi:CCA tRNA nucleotidyltransferase [Bacillus sp. REN16]|uniref:CCA tRNA nucleotidyltransferase n=1 Tax=Bacillus sp. REN16 TaxID=2887296 RepID=UPI001E2D1F61|nr:CCA tRNA nucleotidyltransferase [Bacillus sp. REN16]MCC3358350.1 CCA tRNA nucleotidyltransferase [Bacillus sp. REN16]